jgi:ArsR family transcriptional regulator
MATTWSCWTFGQPSSTPVSIPVGELRRRLAELPGDREIVAYCRGPYCAFAHEAVAVLREEGFSAWRLEDGLPEWQAAGLAVTRT